MVSLLTDKNGLQDFPNSQTYSQLIKEHCFGTFHALYKKQQWITIGLWMSIIRDPKFKQILASVVHLLSNTGSVGSILGTSSGHKIQN